MLIKSLPEDRVVDDFAILSRPFIFTVVDAANLESDIVDKAIDNMRKHAASEVNNAFVVGGNYHQRVQCSDYQVTDLNDSIPLYGFAHMLAVQGYCQVIADTSNYEIIRV